MNAETRTLPPLQPRKRSLPPVFLSAFVYPGIGQLAQRRRWVGALFALAFTVPFVWLAVQTFKIVVIYFNLAFNWRTAAEAPEDSGLLRPFLLTVVLYAANVVDTALAQRRSNA
jgi:hypothetical protein